MKKLWLAGGLVFIAALGVIAVTNQDKVLEFAQKFHTTPQEPSAISSPLSTEQNQSAFSQCPSGSVSRSEANSSQQKRVKRNLEIVPGTNDQCVCQDNYLWNNTEGICELDCAQIMQQLDDLRQSSTSQGSPEILQEIQELQDQIQINHCVANDNALQAKKCEEYQQKANQSLLSKQYLAYYDYNKKYIDGNCSGHNTDVCLNTLAEAKILNGLQALIQEPTLLQTLQKEQQTLKDSYYANMKCNQVEERCSTLEPIYGGNAFAPQSAMAALSVPLNIEGLTPRKIFQDDRAYYDRYCTCQKLVSQYPTTDTIPQNQKDQFSACFKLLNPNAKDPQQTNTQQTEDVMGIY